MSGIAEQFPPEAIGAAAGVFTYSFICLLLSSALLWATIAHREWKSYVALLALFISLSTLVNMIQQLHTYLDWVNLKFAQSDYVKANYSNPELSVAGPSVGIDLVLFYIQWYCYNVEAILVLVWCYQLAHSVFQMEVSVSVQRYGGNMAKATAILLPVIQVVLMRSKILQSSTIGFYFVANFIMAISLALGAVLLVAILVKYVSTQSEMSWHVGYADRRPADIESQPTNSLATRSSGSAPRRRSIYDNWLIVRFTIAFAGLAAFELVTIMSEIAFAIGTTLIAQDEIVNLRPSHAITDVTSFVPGVSASILAFVVFGTTKVFRDFFYTKLVPQCIRCRLERRTKIPPVISSPWQDHRQRNSLQQAPDLLISPVLVLPSGESFEMSNEHGGLARKLSMRDGIHEVSTPTPSSSTFKIDHVGDDDQHPILERNSQRLTAWPQVPEMRGQDRQ
ncbi:hypothetical protein BD289DRAFT_478952 [Coniella lustricola]|uniref:Uncharacterized protein n=1 Tax=Coniella lustricola TaxID=2025994 RepID=A0A2T3AKU8_9PEZI|nr:hypothetical protein BD289DRAFT_478952 [Coniella lustricola]